MGFDGGGQNLPKMAMFVYTLSICITLMTTVLFAFAADPSDSSISFDDANVSIQKFSGDSAISYVGWTLDGCYTPGYFYNSPDTIQSGANYWLSGDDVSYQWFTQTGINSDGNKIYNKGITSATYGDGTGFGTRPNDPIRLNINEKSDIHLQSVRGGSIIDLFGESSVNRALQSTTQDATLFYWYFSGWRYQFSPVSPVQADDYITQDVKLNIVWYSNPYERYDESIDAGFLIYAENNGFVAYTDAVSLQEVVNNYNWDSNYASKFQFNLGGNTVYMFFRFDQGVLNTMSEQDAFSNGYWSVQFASPVVESFDYTQTSSVQQYNVTSGNIMSTLVSILTLSNENIPSPWNIIIGILIYVPSAIVTSLWILQVLDVLKPF